MTPRTHNFEAIALPDGRRMVNLGSSARVAPGWNNIDFSWLLRLSKWPRTAMLLNRIGLLSEDRYQRLRQVTGAVIVWDLRRGVPFADGTFDVVYHSHLLEHIAREHAEGFLRECRRVLRPRGIVRIVVPDLELLARRYLAVLDGANPEARATEVGDAVAEMIDQMIVRTPELRAQRSFPVRLLEALFIGNTDRAGVLHRWMYDRVSLRDVLSRAGFVDVQVRTPGTSEVAGWKGFGLDENADGSTYKQFSLYVEARRSG